MSFRIAWGKNLPRDRMELAPGSTNLGRHSRFRRERELSPTLSCQSPASPKRYQKWNRTTRSPRIMTGVASPLVRHLQELRCDMTFVDIFPHVVVVSPTSVGGCI